MQSYSNPESRNTMRAAVQLSAVVAIRHKALAKSLAKCPCPCLAQTQPRLSTSPRLAA